MACVRCKKLSIVERENCFICKHINKRKNCYSINGIYMEEEVE